MSLILAVESSTLCASVALLSDREVLEHKQSDVNNHSELILPMIDECLSTHGIGLGDLAHIAVGVGPGSFTGLRIGMATVKGLCFAANLPLVGVSSLYALANDCLLANPELAETDQVIVPILDARRGEVFVAALCAGSFESKMEEVVLAPDAVEAALAEIGLHSSADFLVCGNGPSRYPDPLSDFPLAKSPSSPTPTAVSVGLLSSKENAESSSVASLAPSYVRLPEAVIKFPDGNTGGTFSKEKVRAK